MASLRVEHELGKAHAQELLASLGYNNETVPLALWRELKERACQHQFLDRPNRYNKAGGQPLQHVLLHRLHFHGDGGQPFPGRILLEVACR